MALSGSCRAHNVPSTTENRGQQTLLSTSKATHKPPAHHTFGLLNTPVGHQPVSDSQAEYAGSIPVIRSTKHLVRGCLVGNATVAVPRPCHFGVRYRSDFGRTVRHAARKSWLPRSSSDRKRRGETCPHDRRRVTTCDEVGQSSSSECRIQNELGQPSCRVSRLPFIETESGFDKPSPTSMLSQDHRQCPPEQANLVEWHLERSCLLGMDSSHLAAGAPVVASMTSATSPMYFSQIRPPGRYGRPQPINS